MKNWLVLGRCGCGATDALEHQISEKEKKKKERTKSQ